MRKLKLQVQITVDGAIAGPKGEMEHFTFNWDDRLKDHVTEITEPVDTILLGRNLAQGFIPYWKSVADDPSNPEVDSGRKFTDTKKVVFSRTLQRSEWPDTDLASRDIGDEVQQLKHMPGGDIIAYGGGTFVRSLIEKNLIDEYHLFINPVALGNGMMIFNHLPGKLELKLDACIPFDCGIVLMRYTRSVSPSITLTSATHADAQ